MTVETCVSRLDARAGARHGLWLASTLFSGMFALAGVRRWNTLDAHAYWFAWHHPFYSLPSGAPNAYLYSPAFAQVIWPFNQLPWPVFLTLWIAVLTSATVWLVLPLGHWALPFFLVSVPAIITGNIYPLFALVVVLGMRRPIAWVLPLLTKVTPGVGLVWFAVRREWRSLVMALAVTVGVAAVSAVFAPREWANWLAFLVHQRHATHASGYTRSGLPAPSLVFRLPAAVAVVAYAARTDRRWLVPFGMLLADPMFAWFALLLLASIPRLREQASPYTGVHSSHEQGVLTNA